MEYFNLEISTKVQLYFQIIKNCAVIFQFSAQFSPFWCYKPYICLRLLFNARIFFSGDGGESGLSWVQPFWRY